VPTGYVRRFQHPEQTSLLSTLKFAQAWKLSYAAEYQLPINRKFQIKKYYNGRISRENSMA
jgi:hypothetical protein